ncbi:MAG: hypothetical protein KDA21_03120 [Phycisphaerales bacterium]|nr:hypothetical protein [Phycisphaerales bacterium]
MTRLLPLLAAGLTAALGTTAHLTAADATVEPGASATVLIEAQITRQDGAAASQRGHLTATDEDGGTVRPQGGGEGVLVFIGDGIEFDADSGASEVLSSPRLLTRSSESAEILIGQALTYVELTGEDDAMQLVTEEGVHEGLRLRVTPVALGTDRVRLESLELTLSEVVGRLDIATADGRRSLPIPGGRPLVRSVTYRLPVTLGSGQEAVVLVRSPGEGGEGFVVRLRATVRKADAAG